MKMLSITQTEAQAIRKTFMPQSMTEMVSNFTAKMSDVEEALFNQRGIKEAPFRNLDKTGRAVCRKHSLGICPYPNTCPLRHVVGEKRVVCKHWLRRLCKKGDGCGFLHEYDLTKMPECFFFSKYGVCSSRECPFRHVDPETKITDCRWYDRGFCRHGPLCKNRHRRRAVCPNYLIGFCPKGPDCQLSHPSFSIPTSSNSTVTHQKPSITCHRLTAWCSLPRSYEQEKKRNRSDVTCYKCGEKGHYANRCHKGAPTFLSNTAHLAQREKVAKEQR